MSIRLRDYRREDFDTLWRLDQACFPPGISYNRLELGSYIRRSAVTLVAEKHAVKIKSFSGAATTTLGFIIAEAQRGGSGHITTIDVAAAARRTGVGSLLLKAAEERLRAAKCTKVTLETMVTNTTAIRFYERHGYESAETVPSYYADGTDALMMEKDLLFSPVPSNLMPHENCDPGRVGGVQPRSRGENGAGVQGRALHSLDGGLRPAGSRRGGRGGHSD